MEDGKSILVRIRTVAKLKATVGTLASICSFGTGAVFLVLAWFASKQLSALVLVTSAIAFFIGLITGVFVVNMVWLHWHGKLVQQIKMNLAEKELLLVAMIDHTGEKLPSLRSSSHASSRAINPQLQIPLTERLIRLVNKYPSCCKDLGLSPFPERFNTLPISWLKALIPAFLIFGIGGFITNPSPHIQHLMPIILGFGFVCFGLFLVTLGMSELAVCDSIIEQLGDQELLKNDEVNGPLEG